MTGAFLVALLVITFLMPHFAFPQEAQKRVFARQEKSLQKREGFKNEGGKLEK